jgi:hypothetical protein
MMLGLLCREAIGASAEHTLPDRTLGRMAASNNANNHYQIPQDSWVDNKCKNKNHFMLSFIANRLASVAVIVSPVRGQPDAKDAVWEFILSGGPIGDGILRTHISHLTKDKLDSRPPADKYAFQPSPALMRLSHEETKIELSVKGSAITVRAMMWVNGKPLYKTRERDVVWTWTDSNQPSVKPDFFGLTRMGSRVMRPIKLTNIVLTCTEEP